MRVCYIQISCGHQKIFLLDSNFKFQIVTRDMFGVLESDLPAHQRGAPYVSRLERPNKRKSRRSVLVSETVGIEDFARRIHRSATGSRFRRGRESLWWRVLAYALQNGNKITVWEAEQEMQRDYRYVLDKFSRRWDNNGCMIIFEYVREMRLFRVRPEIISALSTEARQALLSTALKQRVRLAAQATDALAPPSLLDQGVPGSASSPVPVPKPTDSAAQSSPPPRAPLPPLEDASHPIRAPDAAAASAGDNWCWNWTAMSAILQREDEQESHPLGACGAWCRVDDAAASPPSPPLPPQPHPSQDTPTDPLPFLLSQNSLYE